MKEYRRRILLGFFMAVLVMMFPMQAFAKPEVIMEKSKVSIAVGKSVQLRAIARGKSKKIKWSSTNQKVATVSSKGKVTGKKIGKATIMAKANGASAKCVVTVLSKKAAKIRNAKIAYKQQLEDYDFIQKFSVKDVTGDGIPDQITENRYGAIFLDTYTTNDYYTGKPRIVMLGWGDNVYVNKKKKQIISYDYEYGSTQIINGITYRNVTMSSYKVSVYKENRAELISEYARFSGGFNGYYKRTSASKSTWGRWVAISERTYNSAIRSLLSGTILVVPQYSNTASNRKAYII